MPEVVDGSDEESVESDTPEYQENPKNLAQELAELSIPSSQKSVTKVAERRPVELPVDGMKLGAEASDEDGGEMSPSLACLQSPISPSRAVTRSMYREKSTSSSGRRAPNSASEYQLGFAMDVSFYSTTPPSPPPQSSSCKSFARRSHRVPAEQEGLDQDVDQQHDMNESDYYYYVGPTHKVSVGGAQAVGGGGEEERESSGVSSCAQSEHLHPTHRAQQPFHPRSHGQLLLEMGDPVAVERDWDDHWSTGTNLRTGQMGVFPTSLVFEVDIVDDLVNTGMGLKTDERDTFYLTMLGSIEVAHHKGNDVLVQGINKILELYQNRQELIVPRSVLLEVSFKGVHIIDKGKKNIFRCPMFDYFYSLQNISFCGAHPKQLRYFAFITKHPLLPRFACHAFLSASSTQPIVEAIGRAFKRSYDEYMAFAHPTEDIFIE